MKNIIKLGIHKVQPHMEMLKVTFQNIPNIFRNTNNVYGYECPDCCSDVNRATARSTSLYDEKYKKIRFYIHCASCGRTTPAFDTLKEASYQWEDQWILKEDSILLGDNKCLKN